MFFSDQESLQVSFCEMPLFQQKDSSNFPGCRFMFPMSVFWTSILCYVLCGIFAHPQSAETSSTQPNKCVTQGFGKQQCSLWCQGFQQGSQFHLSKKQSIALNERRETLVFCCWDLRCSTEHLRYPCAVVTDVVPLVRQCHNLMCW